MATSEPRLSVKQSLTPSELDDVGALVREARWNQLAADWRIFIEFGRLYAIHGEAGRVIATTATLPYGGRFAWISMVLVAGEYRRRGLATALLRRAMADLTAAKLVPVLRRQDHADVVVGVGHIPAETDSAGHARGDLPRLARGMPSLGKDTHYDTRDGQF